MSTLAEFYAHMRPYLQGARDLAQTRERLGPSPSGDHDFAFYRVLAERNVFRIMNDLYAPLRGLIIREQPGTWTPLVREYVAAHPPSGRHPNGLGEHFSEFLEQRRQRHPEQPDLYEELADYCWVRHAVYSAPDEPGDGFERRLYVRQYSVRIHDYAAALERDPQHPRPEPQPTVLLIYRHARTLETRLFLPSAAGLVALARRQGEPVPEPLRAIPAEHVDVADAQLVDHGVLMPR